MKAIHAKLIKAALLKWAIDQGLKVSCFTDDRFTAEDQWSVLDLELRFVQALLSQGWKIEDICENETNCKVA